MFGTILKKRILEKYDTYTDFAKKCNINKTTLSEVINNRKLPREKNLNIYLKNLQPLTEEQEKELIREWSFGRSKNKLRSDFENLENKNKNMLGVLSRVKNEQHLLEEVDQLKQYEEFYEILFKNLNANETKAVLKAILKELKIIALDNGKQEVLKPNFERLESIINKIK